MNKYRVTISDEALVGVEKYLNYIANDQAAPLNAARWWDKAVEKIFSLDQFPLRYPYAPENEFEDLTIRMLIVDRCLFLYIVDEEQATVRILRFRHGSQLPRPLDQ